MSDTLGICVYKVGNKREEIEYIIKTKLQVYKLKVQLAHAEIHSTCYIFFIISEDWRPLVMTMKQLTI